MAIITLVIYMNNNLIRRKNIRLKEYDYSSNGAYFVTICTYKRQCLFGKIIDGKMVLSEYGKIVNEEWLKSQEIRKEIILDQYVIMPDHFHGIVMIDNGFGMDSVDDVGVRRWQTPNKYKTANAYTRASQRFDDFCLRTSQRGAPTANQLRPNTIGSMICQFKSSVTKSIKQIHNYHTPIWQRGFHDRIIRTPHELTHTRQYIHNNPLKWDMDSAPLTK